MQDLSTAVYCWFSSSEIRFRVFQYSSIALLLLLFFCNVHEMLQVPTIALLQEMDGRSVATSKYCMLLLLLSRNIDAVLHIAYNNYSDTINY